MDLGIDSGIVLIGETGALFGTLTEGRSREEFNRWALQWALDSLELGEFLPLVVAHYGEDALREALGVEPEQPENWSFPVGEGDYPPELWYAATWHDLTGSREQPLGRPRQHTGIDLNLDFAERGDVERRLGLSVYAVAAGQVTYVTPDWNGAPMVVVQHEHEGAPLWVRYAHIVPVVQVGARVQAGDKLGAFADWVSGDHLHLDMAQDAITREWLTAGIEWVDPVPVLQAHLDNVAALLARGDV